MGIPLGKGVPVVVGGEKELALWSTRKGRGEFSLVGAWDMNGAANANPC